ncbi:Holliday junction branch migration protein RuvA [Paenibacillus sp. 598K]|uniref:Holliday junction branch migration protein RuvA n=1 Tax=Paenibacillus sp. 598K TaxID=1117987 RepID=UPI000FFA7751|nr:Holliday junction branch migration protein RuvA [Paenibacillus sp. 598K]GBF73897.1 Holliday junction branch migration protein RuvA [Paenibacillus sp. 598K]
MIDYLKGQVAHVEAEYIVLDVRDIGYRVFTPSPYAFAGKQEQVTVYIHHHVREDAVLLFGFATREEQRLFRQLLDVSGIGPRVALGILAGGRPEAVIGAVQQENIAFLTKLPGIGRKTAQRMILDLKDKLAAMPIDGSVATAIEEPGLSAADGGIVWREAREALAALGYTSAELDRAWQSLKDEAEGASVEQLMKKALQHLFKG